MPYSTNATVDLSPEAELLFRYVSSSQHDTDLAGSHSMRTAPLFTEEALNVIGTTVLPQRAVYGNVLHSPKEPSPLTKLYVNTNAPFSAVVCGLQVRVFIFSSKLTQAQSMYEIVSGIGLWQKSLDGCSSRRLFDSGSTSRDASRAAMWPAVRYFTLFNSSAILDQPAVLSPCVAFTLTLLQAVDSFNRVKRRTWL